MGGALDYLFKLMTIANHCIYYIKIISKYSKCFF